MHLLPLEILLLLSLTITVTGHMVMSQPPPIDYKTNPSYSTSKADYDYTAPLDSGGGNYPCRGHLADLSTPQGASVATYNPGGTYELKLDGSATHNGGSCQASLSYDSGKTFTVIKSWIGNCPHPDPGGDQTFQFTIPSSAPSGTAVFAWSWFNNIGNREMYMDCAVVTIGGGKKARRRSLFGLNNNTTQPIKRALSGPAIFKANIGNGCTTVAGKDVIFPDAGSDVQYGSAASAQAAPSGSCGNQVTTSQSGSSSSGDSSSSGSSSSSSSSSSGGETSGSSSSDGAASPSQTTATDTGNGHTIQAQGAACKYWESKGYTCSSAPPSLSPWDSWWFMLFALLFVVGRGLVPSWGA